MADTAALERLERRLELVLRDLRAYRAELQAEAKDKGALGSRGLTQFMLDQIKSFYQQHACGLTITELLLAAERAGYKIPTARTLSKRLTERAYRVGDIEWRAGRVPGAGYWYWKDTGGN